MRRDQLVTLGATGALLSSALAFIAVILRFFEVRASEADQQVLAYAYVFTLASAYLFAGAVALALWRLDAPPTTRSTVSSVIGGLGAGLVAVSFVAGELFPIDTFVFARVGQIAMGLWLVETNWRIYRTALLSRNLSTLGAIFGLALVITSIGVWIRAPSGFTSIALIVTFGFIAWQAWLGITLLRLPAAGHTVAAPRPPVSTGSASSSPGQGGEV